MLNKVISIDVELKVLLSECKLNIFLIVIVYFSSSG